MRNGKENVPGRQERGCSRTGGKRRNSKYIHVIANKSVKKMEWKMESAAVKHCIVLEPYG